MTQVLANLVNKPTYKRKREINTVSFKLQLQLSTSNLTWNYWNQCKGKNMLLSTAYIRDKTKSLPSAHPSLICMMHIKISIRRSKL